MLLCVFAFKTSPTGAAVQTKSSEMVIDGQTLARVLGHASDEQLLAALIVRCRGVIVCRASPAQKAAILKLMKRYHAIKEVRTDFCLHDFSKHGAFSASFVRERNTSRLPSRASHPISGNVKHLTSCTVDKPLTCKQGACKEMV